MKLSTLDWSIIFAFFIISLAIGLWVSRRSGKGFVEYFLSGRNMPWWLLGVSMVATTFSADTPNLVTDIVRQDGVAGNWVWWAFLLTGMLTVFVYAKLWRRSGILTDLEFYELRYSGEIASFLRGFRAIYLGVFFNVMILATVNLAAIKIGFITLGLEAWETILYGSIITVIYTSLGGLRGVILTDFVQFTLAMIGMVWAAIYIVNMPEIGGLNNLLTHENVSGSLNIIPDFSDPAQLIPLFLIPIAVQWWSVWYPGAEPGGGGYIVQRVLSAKNEKHAIGATLLFNVAHYALRPWPWILIALASLVMFPDLEALTAAFPAAEGKVEIQNDLAFSAMLTYLPKGLVGLVIAALIAAYMSTLSTQLNWGSSYVVHDVVKRFLKPEAEERELVLYGRMSTIGLMILSALLALVLSNALQAFNILLQIGAGTGLLFILRWFWWRINAYSELTAMVSSFLVAILLELPGFDAWESHEKLVLGVVLTTIAWVTVTFNSKPTDTKTLIRFFKLIKPHPMGWQPILNEMSAEDRAAIQPGSSLGLEIACMIVGCFTVYGLLFATGFWIYGNTAGGIVATSVSVTGIIVLFRLWKRLKVE